MIKSNWNKLDHNQKRWIAISTGLAAVLLVAYLAGSDSETTSRSNKRESAIRAVLTDKSTRDVSIDSLAANMKIVSRENTELKRELEKLKKNVINNKGKNTDTTDLNNQVERLKSDFATLKQETQDRAVENERALKARERERDLASRRQNRRAESSDSGSPADNVAGSDNTYGVDEDAHTLDLFDEAPVVKPQTNPETGERIPLRIVSHVQLQPEEKIEDDVKEELYMPAASIMTGVLLNGLDAPTGQGARKDPFPVAVRIQKEAVLPNHYRADVRECFALASGYGDLSTERAFLRTETISCVREDGGVIEAKLKGYIVGEDGKAGLRGRLVSKQGQIIAKSLMAGFAGGVANAFDVNPVPVINTSPGGSTQYQETMSSGLMQGAAMKGASTALDRVAQFYIEMAESMFPVVEIDAGRRADIIITGGVKLKISQ